MAEKSVNKAKKTSSKTKNKSKLKFSKETYIKWFKDMTLMRKFEEKCGQLYIQQKFGGFLHLYIGQEAIVAGTVSASKPTDFHMTAYRDHAHPIGLGTDVRPLMAELYGRQTGISKGKGGSMHFFDKERNFLGGHGIVGAQIPMGTGIAFAEKYKGTQNVTFVSFGDGASMQGALHESFNLAMVWKLPVIYIIENNNYGMGTSLERITNITDLSKLGSPYGMPSLVVDGMTPEAVHDAVAVATERARKGEGPTLLDIRTYRYKGHSMSDPGKYRTKEEVKEFQAKDPIEHVLGIIKENNFLKEEEIKEIQDWVTNEINEAVEFAENSEYPPAEELYKDVYKTEGYPFIKEYL